MDDVKKWLTNMGLDAYLPQFTENAISGEVLLELGTEDLDYMKITALGHRKVIGTFMRRRYRALCELCACCICCRFC